MLKKLLWGAGIVTGLGIVGAVVPESSTQPTPVKTSNVTNNAVQNTSVTPSSVTSISPVNTASNQESSSCHPSYSGCLKADASDYDCAGGSGNGPYYTGRVSVIGPDVFDLDRDNDGIGCE